MDQPWAEVDDVIASLRQRLLKDDVSADVIDTLLQRTFVEAAAAWRRWPEQGALADDVVSYVREARRAAVSQAQPPDLLRVALEDDDGSPEWGTALLFFEVAEVALASDPPAQIASLAQKYLEEWFNIITNDIARERSKPISQADANELVRRDPRWADALTFVRTLSES